MAKWIHLPRDQRPRLIACWEEDELTIYPIAGTAGRGADNNGKLGARRS